MTGLATRAWEGITIPAAGTYMLDQAHKRIGFLARHMMVSPVRGEFGEATAQIVVGEDPLASSVTAIIHTASVTTGNGDRDAHLSSADFLDVERYPTMVYRSNGIKWQGSDDPIFYWARLRGTRAGPPQGRGQRPGAGAAHARPVRAHRRADHQVGHPAGRPPGGVRRRPPRPDRSGHLRLQRDGRDRAGRLRAAVERHAGKRWRAGRQECADRDRRRGHPGRPSAGGSAPPRRPGRC